MAEGGGPSEGTLGAGPSFCTSESVTFFCAPFILRKRATRAAVTLSPSGLLQYFRFDFARCSAHHMVSHSREHTGARLAHRWQSSTTRPQPAR
jgi:hypothetical protein